MKLPLALLCKMFACLNIKTKTTMRWSLHFSEKKSFSLQNPSLSLHEKQIVLLPKSLTVLYSISCIY